MNTDKAEDARLELGLTVRRLREDAGYTRELAAGLAGMSIDGLKLIESGKSWPQTDTMIRLAVVLGVTVNDLIPASAYSDLRTPALSFLERRFASQALPQEAARGGGAGSDRSSASSRAGGKGSKRASGATRQAASGGELGQVAPEAIPDRPADLRTKRTKKGVQTGRIG